jgi:predicted nucleotidyltransferase
MNKYQIEDLKKTIIKVLKRHGVKKAALFGSIVRRES